MATWAARAVVAMGMHLPPEMYRHILSFLLPRHLSRASENVAYNAVVGSLPRFGVVEDAPYISHISRRKWGAAGRRRGTVTFFNQAPAAGGRAPPAGLIEVTQLYAAPYAKRWEEWKRAYSAYAEPPDRTAQNRRFREIALYGHHP